MNVGAVSAVGSGTTTVYAVLSPYLNGVVRTSDAAAAAALQATTAATSAAATAAAIAARGTAADAVTAQPPFDNPAIADIADRIALGQSLTPPAAVTPDALLGASALALTAPTTPLGLASAADATVGTTLASSTTTPATDTSQLTTTPPPQPTPAEQVLYGDSGTLIQSYGAIALVAGSQALPPVFSQPVTPLVTQPALVTSAPRLGKVE